MTSPAVRSTTCGKPGPKTTECSGYWRNVPEPGGIVLSRRYSANAQEAKPISAIAARPPATGGASSATAAATAMTSKVHGRMPQYTVVTSMTSGSSAPRSRTRGRRERALGTMFMASMVVRGRGGRHGPGSPDRGLVNAYLVRRRSMGGCPRVIR